MNVINLTNPGVDPIDGDFIRIEHDNGSAEEKYFYTPVPVPDPVPVIDPCEWLIDIGPFFDRFGTAKIAVLTSADPVVKAILADVQIRKWIDLKRQDVLESLAYIGSKVAAVTPALQVSIINTPVTLEENLALRKMYFK